MQIAVRTIYIFKCKSLSAGSNGQNQEAPGRLHIRHINKNVISQCNVLYKPDYFTQLQKPNDKFRGYAQFNFFSGQEDSKPFYLSLHKDKIHKFAILNNFELVYSALNIFQQIAKCEPEFIGYISSSPALTMKFHWAQPKKYQLNLCYFTAVISQGSELG